MTKCKEMEKLFYKRDVEDIFPEELKVLESHIDECDNCQKENKFWVMWKEEWKDRRESYKLFQESSLEEFSEEEKKEIKESAKKILANFFSFI